MLAPTAAIVTAPEYVPVESPPALAPTENDPLFVPEAVVPPLIVSQDAEEEAVQVRVPEPLFAMETVWLEGFAPFWMAESDIEAGFREIMGADGTVATVDVFGVNS